MPRYSRRRSRTRSRRRSIKCRTRSRSRSLKCQVSYVRNGKRITYFRKKCTSGKNRSRKASRKGSRKGSRKSSRKGSRRYSRRSRSQSGGAVPPTQVAAQYRQQVEQFKRLAEEFCSSVGRVDTPEEYKRIVQITQQIGTLANTVGQTNMTMQAGIQRLQQELVRMRGELTRLQAQKQQAPGVIESRLQQQLQEITRRYEAEMQRVRQEITQRETQANQGLDRAIIQLTTRITEAENTLRELGVAQSVAQQAVSQTQQTVAQQVQRIDPTRAPQPVVTPGQIGAVNLRPVQTGRGLFI